MNPAHPSRIQFSLRTVLFAVLVLAGFIAALRQFGGGGFFVFLCGLGLVLLAGATWHRDPRRGTLGFALVLGTLPYFGAASRSVDHTEHPVRIVVVDAESGRPISGARVSLYKKSQATQSSAGATDAQGATILLTKFKTSRYEFALTRRGRIWLWEHSVLVERSGYEPLECPLDDLTGKTHDLFGQPLPLVSVELARAQ